MHDCGEHPEFWLHACSLHAYMHVVGILDMHVVDSHGLHACHMYMTPHNYAMCM